MLDSLRKSDSWLLRGLLLLIALAFALVYGVVSLGRLEVVAEVNGEQIVEQELERAVQNMDRFYREQLGDSLPRDLLRQQALQQLITTRLAVAEARRLGLAVSDEELRAAIRSQFGEGFTEERYRDVLRRMRYTPADFEDQQRDALLQQKLQQIIQAGVHVTDAQARALFRYENEEVSLRVLRVPARDFRDEVEVDEAAVTAYYEENAESFRLPEQVRIRYALFEPEDFATGVEIAEADARAYYESHLDDFERENEEVRARHILIRVAPDADEAARLAARARAEGLLAAIRDGADFAALATEQSEDPGSQPAGGDLGYFARGSMVEPFEQAAFALAPGEVSEVVETSFGFHLIKVEDRREPGTAPFADVRDEIEEVLRERRGREAARDAVQTAHERVRGGASLEDAVAQAGAADATVDEPPPFGRGEPIPGLPGSAELSELVFRTPTGSVGDIGTLDAGYVLFTVEERIASHVPPLAAVRDAVERAVRQRRAAERARERAAALLEQVQAGTSLEQVAAAAGLEVIETGPVGRLGTYVNQVGNAPELKAAAFALSEASPVAPAVYAVGNDAAVAVLDERLPADESLFESRKEAIVERQRQQLAGVAYQRFLEQLHAQANVVVRAG